MRIYEITFEDGSIHWIKADGICYDDTTIRFFRQTDTDKNLTVGLCVKWKYIRMRDDEEG